MDGRPWTTSPTGARTQKAADLAIGRAHGKKPLICYGPGATILSPSFYDYEYVHTAHTVRPIYKAAHDFGPSPPSDLSPTAKKC